MNWKKLKENWVEEERKGFKGWDFSQLAGRKVEGATPWNYKNEVVCFLDPRMQLLDMGTGGGEFLLELNHPYDHTSVTEAWEPNVLLCKNKLEPMGIRVEQVFDDADLPYDDQSFDVIINRHEAYDVSEVRRILKPGGLFITQQVGSKNNEWLSTFLIEGFQSHDDFNLQTEVRKFEDCGFHIKDQQEAFPSMRFYDVGAVVYFAKIIEWEFPGFSVETHMDRLIELQKMLKSKGFIESVEHRFFIIACKEE